MKIDQKGGKEPQNIMTAPGNKSLESVSNSERNTGSSAATWKFIFSEHGTYTLVCV